MSDVVVTLEVAAKLADDVACGQCRTCHGAGEAVGGWLL